MASQLQVVVQANSCDDLVFDVSGPALRIGRDESNEIHLPSPYVSRLQASLSYREGRLFLRAEGLNPTIVNEKEVQPSETTELRPGDVIVVPGDFLKIRASGADQGATDAEVRSRFTGFVRALHEAVINRLDPRVHKFENIHAQEGRQAALELLREELERLAVARDQPLVAYASREAIRTTLLLTLLGQAAAAFDAEVFGKSGPYVEHEKLRAALSAKVLAELGLRVQGEDVRAGIRRLREGFEIAYGSCSRDVTRDLGRHLTLWLLRKDVCDLMFGLGPLTDLLAMPDVSEIMVVSKDLIYIENSGTLEETGRTFINDRVVEQVLQRILGPVNRRVDRSSPMVDARLPDGSRVNAVIPPLALKGPCVTIRRFSQNPLTIDDLVGFGALTSQVATFLRACVKGRKNIVISGGTGSGKTTLLNALSGWIPGNERIVTIEDTAELRLQQRHVVTLEAKPRNLQDKGEITIRELVKNALRMRPDRIVVGECRGKEALDMLQAMNTGHEGSMTTAHANSPADMLQRLEVMVLEAEKLPIEAVRRQIVSGVDLVIQQTRLREGARRVVSVTEVVGLDAATGDVIVEDIFTAREGGVMMFTGYLPTFAEELTRAGHLNAAEVFWES